MRLRALSLAFIMFVVPRGLVAQHAAASATSRVPPREAAQFDFLVGQWELEARPRATTFAQRVHGAPRLVGTWKAWRALDGFGVEDELRLTDGSGNPLAFTHAVRYYSAPSRRWIISVLDVYRGTFMSLSGEARPGEILVTSRGADPDGTAYLSRTRFHAITPSGFKVQIDRSYDDGKRWTEGYLRIDARRVAATAAR
jgi:hypothetical protein